MTNRDRPPTSPPDPACLTGASAPGAHAGQIRRGPSTSPAVPSIIRPLHPLGKRDCPVLSRGEQNRLILLKISGGQEISEVSCCPQGKGQRFLLLLF